MTNQKTSKINQLLKIWPRGTVAVQSWLTKNNISKFLANYYVEAQWLQRMGKGAYIISGDKVVWTGGLYALQELMEMKVHVAARTALEMQGHAQFVPQHGPRTIWLFASSSETRSLPRWMHDFFADQVKIEFSKRKLFLNDRLGLTKKNYENYNITIASRERAMMEYLDLVPDLESYNQAIYLMEGLKTLRPELIQVLLEQCRSVKVKRLFMYLAEEENHSWIKKLDLSRVDFGSGKRVIGRGGHFNSKYNLSVPIINEG